MPTVTLPDGSKKSFKNPVTVQKAAESIGAGLAKAALAGKLNDRLVDTSCLIEEDTNLTIITDKDPEGLEIIRHSTAHLLAQAVKQLFPKAQVTIGPVIEDGFYYDFAYEPGFREEDLEKIETRMGELVKQNLEVTHEVIDRKKAIKFFLKIAEDYKAEIIKDLPEEEVLTIYKQGDFTDLCRGPHVPTTGKLKAFKLTKLAGAYWRGDPNNEMLQRIYGTAWPNKESLNDYLHKLEEAKKRDHRVLAKKMDLFHLQPEAPGMIFWHEKGWILYRTVQQYLREKWIEHDYQEIRTPQLLDRSLWEKSGHWDKFSNEMFVTETENHTYAIKPMSCPGHVQIFNQGIRSYKDLPLRLAEFGNCHRCEPSGTLHGLMRVRAMVQDDGHIFCTEEQIQPEVAQFIQQIFHVYADFGFTDILVKLATRPEKRVGSNEAWDKAEQSLEIALNSIKIKWNLNAGEGAFYGPKLEFHLRDCLGRIWQCGTIQVDFSMPERLNAYYIAEDGSKRVPVMLHRAIFGSIERFLGILLEETAGNLPVWLSPVQAVVLNITDTQRVYTEKITESLKSLGVRAKSDLRNEKISFKIREHTVQRVPYLLIIGDREVDNNEITVRTQVGENLGSMTVGTFVKHLTTEINQRHSRLGGKQD